MNAYSQDLRDRVIHAHEAEGQTRGQIAKRYHVSASGVGKVVQCLWETGRRSAKPHGGGRRATISGELA